VSYDVENMIRVVRANLKDIASRRVYSDVLDDLGHSMAAEFIRRHCDVYELHTGHEDRHSHTVRADLAAALAAGEVFPPGNVVEDCDTLDLEISNGYACRWNVYRGLIDRFYGDVENWVRIADAIVRWHPLSYARVFCDRSSHIHFTAPSDGLPQRLTVAVPGTEPLGPIPVSDQHRAVAVTIERLLGERWPGVEFRVVHRTY
jgi:uncharacterized protein (TIGR02996 family)